MSSINLELKPCPFCGGTPTMFGAEIRDCVEGLWAGKSRKEYWVNLNCFPCCPHGNAAARAYGIIGGVHYTSPEAAADAWNRREE